MTRWCPVCESPGIPVVQGRGPGSSADAVQVSRDLPGIEPTHFCTRCPTFFRSRDRFYLTAQHGDGVHGISVWPHGERHLSIEVGEEGLLLTFHDSASVLVSRHDSSRIAGDFFGSRCSDDITAWGRRRGFDVRVVPVSDMTAELRVDPPGPHFVLLVTKAWFRWNEVRSTEDGVDLLEWIGARPVLFPPTMAPTV